MGTPHYSSLFRTRARKCVTFRFSFSGGSYTTYFPAFGVGGYFIAFLLGAPELANRSNDLAFTPAPVAVATATATDMNFATALGCDACDAIHQGSHLAGMAAHPFGA